MNCIENTPISIVVVQLLQLPSSGLHNTVSNSNSIVVEACLPRRCIETAVVSLFVSRSLPGNGSILHSMKISESKTKALEVRNHYNAK
jgi:hypothetical protein